MMLRFKNKVVLVSGAAGGIGRAAAIAFAAEGGRVVAADVNEIDGVRVTTPEGWWLLRASGRRSMPATSTAAPFKGSPAMVRSVSPSAPTKSPVPNS